MVSEDILGGLKSALNRGESLRQAMMSFYNAGYKKEDIEVAARALQEQKSGQPVQQTQPIQQTQPVQQIKPKPKEITPQPVKTIQRVSSYGQKPVQKQIVRLQPKPVKTIQRVSSYEKKPGKPKRKWDLFIMISILVVLLGILAGFFIFKQELIDFFNRIFEA